MSQSDHDCKASLKKQLGEELIALSKVLEEHKILKAEKDQREWEIEHNPSLADKSQFFFTCFEILPEMDKQKAYRAL